MPNSDKLQTFSSIMKPVHEPSEAVQDKMYFIINNLAPNNMDQKSAERFVAHVQGRGAQYDDAVGTREELRKRRGEPSAAEAAPPKPEHAHGHGHAHSHKGKKPHAHSHRHGHHHAPH